MTQEEFKKILEEKGYPYREEGNKIVVTRTKSTGFGNINLESLETLPSDVVFDNEGDIRLRDLTSLPSGVEFNNGGDVSFHSLKTIPFRVEFKNWGYVYFGGSLIGGWLGGWHGNIEGIDPKRLLNKMISIGLFDRRK